MVPRWYAGLVLAGTGAVAGSGLAGLVLAVAGAWTPLPATAAGLVGAAAGVLLARRAVPVPTRAGTTAAAAATLAVALVFVGANWEVVGESVVLERDPGLYTATARWIDREGSLVVDARVGPFARADSLEFVSVGMYDRDGTTLEFQSNHLTPALFALGYGLAGVGGMLRVSLLLVACGLLGVHALTVRITGRVWAGPAVVAALAASLPVLSVARDTLTEPVLLLFLWSGLWLWTVAADHDRRPAALAAGLCLGACMAARIDAAVLLVPVPLALAAWGRRGAPRLAGPLLVGLVPGIAVAALDVGFRSRGYIADLDVEVALAYGLLAVSAVAGIVLVRLRDRLPSLGADRRARLGPVLGAVVVLVLLAAWFVRPNVQTALDDDSLLVRSIQAANGDDIDGRRRYHELSMVWQAWYLGPVVVAGAVAGAGLAVRRLVQATDRAVLLPLAVLGAGTGLYLFRPAIAPDHIWAMRRFVPAGLPLFCLLAAMALAAVLDRLPAGRRRALAGGAAIAVALLPIGLRLAPVPAFREQDGFLRLLERTCDVVGPDGVVVAPELSAPGTTSVGQPLAQSLRSWCGVPVALLDGTATPSSVDELAEAWAADGRTLWVVANTTEELADVVTGSDILELGPVSSDRFLEDTLERPPDDYGSFELTAFAVRAGGG